MKIRLMSPALRRRYGETAEIHDDQARAYINAGVAVKLEKVEKKSTKSAKKEKAEDTSK